MEDNVTEEQPNLGPYCLHYKLNKQINSKLHKNINIQMESRIMVCSVEVKLCELHNSNHTFNCAYVLFVKQKCKL